MEGVKKDPDHLISWFFSARLITGDFHNFVMFVTAPPGEKREILEAMSRAKRAEIKKKIPKCSPGVLGGSAQIYKIVPDSSI